MIVAYVAACHDTGRFPVYAANNQLAFARCDDAGEIWVPLLEKALAKLHGCYEALVSGYVDVALRDMTGLPTLTYQLPYSMVPPAVRGSNVNRNPRYFRSLAPIVRVFLPLYCFPLLFLAQLFQLFLLILYFLLFRPFFLDLVLFLSPLPLPPVLSCLPPLTLSQSDA